MEEKLDRQALHYAAERLLDTMDGIFHAQHIKQAYIDGYNASQKEKNNESNKETI